MLETGSLDIGFLRLPIGKDSTFDVVAVIANPSYSLCPRPINSQKERGHSIPAAANHTSIDGSRLQTRNGAERLSVQALSDLEVSTKSLTHQVIRNSDCVGDNGE